ncbi:MAG: phospho-N-acetylmuramoyl-pentapeptide-transferase [Clostridiales bacterium]|nr:phospho-N-acetylmuramoyl-pentapeptide-transferase [Clostridiales bacterium]
MIKLLLAFLTSFLISVILMPYIIKLLKKMSAGQTILGYVENHKEKNGTTTMGGVLFLTVPLFLSFMFLKFDKFWFVTILVSVFFGVLGFLDDFLKVKNKQNLGLKPYQKIVGQLGISVIFAMFVFFSQNAGNIFALFSTKSIDLKFFVIPLIILVLIACSNSVNLTDGLDGLAGNVSLFYLIFFTLISIVISTKLYNAGETGQILTQIESINTLNMLFIGSILAFLMFNTNKASIFMGDVGSLCLGGYIGASACVLGLELILPILGFCFVFSAISVIMQVIYFKLTKKRIFKMAPFHHHLQLSNLSEPKIVAIYSAVTSVLGVICLIFYLL